MKIFTSGSSRYVQYLLRKATIQGNVELIAQVNIIIAGTGRNDVRILIFDDLFDFVERARAAVEMLGE